MAPSWISPTQFARSAPAATLFPIAEEGSRPPLIHIPIGSGDLRFFGTVAGMLDDRPVYGLLPPSHVLVKDVRKKSIHWLMAEYIKQIKSVRKTGPYHLCGYSGGGTLVVELALQLIQAGDEVDFLAVLDPPVRLPRWLNLFYVCVNELCNLTPTTDAIRWRIIRRTNNRLLRWTADEVSRTHMAILAGHTIRSYPGRIVYIRPARSWIRTLNRTQIGKSWSRIARDGTEVHWTPGTHHSILLRGNVESVGAVFQQYLA